MSCEALKDSEFYSNNKPKEKAASKVKSTPEEL